MIGPLQNEVTTDIQLYLKEKTTKIVGLTVIGFQPFHSQSK